MGIERIQTQQSIEQSQDFTKMPRQYVSVLVGTTPSVMDVGVLKAGGAALTVTDFKDGQEGQVIHLLGDGLTTVAHNSFIATNTAADKLLAANAIYTFTRLMNKWYEDACCTGGGGGGGAVTSVFTRTGAVVATAGDYDAFYYTEAQSDALLLNKSDVGHVHTFASLTSKPTTIGGYGITDFNSLGDARWSLLAHSHAFADLTAKPTTIGGYGITDFNSLGDARWSLLAHAHAAADVTSGVFAVARLGTGVPDGTKFLRDDGVFATPAGGGSIDGTGTTGKLPKWLDSNTLTDSIITEAVGNITVGGTFTVTGVSEFRDTFKVGATGEQGVISYSSDVGNGEAGMTIRGNTAKAMGLGAGGSIRGWVDSTGVLTWLLPIISPGSVVNAVNQAAFANVQTSITSLSFAIAAAGVWLIDAMLPLTMVGTFGVKFYFTGPAGLTGEVSMIGTGTTTLTTVEHVYTAAITVPGTFLSRIAGATWVRVTAVIRAGGTAGTVQLVGITGAAGTTCVVKKGASLFAERVS